MQIRAGEKSAFPVTVKARVVEITYQITCCDECHQIRTMSKGNGIMAPEDGSGEPGAYLAYCLEEGRAFNKDDWPAMPNVVAEMLYEPWKRGFPAWCPWLRGLLGDPGSKVRVVQRAPYTEDQAREEMLDGRR